MEVLVDVDPIAGLLHEAAETHHRDLSELPAEPWEQVYARRLQEHFTQ